MQLQAIQKDQGYPCRHIWRKRTKSWLCQPAELNDTLIQANHILLSSSLLFIAYLSFIKQGYIHVMQHNTTAPIGILTHVHVLVPQTFLQICWPIIKPFKYHCNGSFFPWRSLGTEFQFHMLMDQELI